YVRLGSRHQGGHNAPLPGKEAAPNSPFRIRKSSRTLSVLSSPVTTVHGKSWMEELNIMCDTAGSKLALNGKELSRPVQVNGAPGEGEKPAFHEGDLYLCQESLDAFQGALGGVCDAVDAVFANDATKRAFVAVRPPGHHCSADFPSGFCWLNNVHVGIEYAAQTHGLTHAVILDFDLHHGDGSQDITWKRNEENAQLPKNTPLSKKLAIGYYSMHDINSFPCEWGDREKVQNASLCIENAHGQSIWNVHLQPWKTEAEFWQLYKERYSMLLEKARLFLQSHTAQIRASAKSGPPRSAIFISAGFDASEWEGAGMQRHAVNVPTEFYARFTHDVVKMAQLEDTAADGRVISVLEGGYSDRALTSGVLSHLSGLCQPTQASVKQEPLLANGFGDSKEHINSLPLTDSKGVLPVDVDWWSPNRLEALDNHINPPVPQPARKQRAGMMPTYSTPTESFSQKVVDPVKFYRSVSGTVRPVPRPPPPKPEELEVDWVVATHELSKLLIPSDRQTRSCKPEELAAPRVKKDRLSLNSAIPVEPIAGGRQLRDRKGKAPDYAALTSGEESKALPPPRRRTISDLPMPAEPIPDVPIMVSKRSSERSSTASSFGSANVEAVNEVASLPKDPQPSTATTKMPPPTGPAAPKVRKPRAPAKPRTSAGTESKRPPSPRKAASRNIPAPAPALRPPTGDASVTNSSRSTSKESTPDMDGLASAVKRITLKMPTREEHDRRVKEIEEAEKAAGEAKTRARKLGPTRTRKSPTATPPAASPQTGPATKDFASPPDTAPKQEPAFTVQQAVPEFGRPSIPISSLLQNNPATPQRPAEVGVSPAPDATVTSRPQVDQAVNGQFGPSPLYLQTTQSAMPASYPAAPPPFHAQVGAIPAPSLPIIQDPQTPHTAEPHPPTPYQSVPDSAARQLLSEHQATQRYNAPGASQQYPAASIPSMQQHPSARRLPVFGSVGTIPFAPSTSNGPNYGNDTSRSALAQPENVAPGNVVKSEDADIWEVPETPQRPM
ncbi:histone deacetylase, partial [Zalaria obscura]